MEHSQRHSLPRPPPSGAPASFQDGLFGERWGGGGGGGGSDAAPPSLAGPSSRRRGRRGSRWGSSGSPDGGWVISSCRGRQHRADSVAQSRWLVEGCASGSSGQRGEQQCWWQRKPGCWQGQRAAENRRKEAAGCRQEDGPCAWERKPRGRCGRCGSDRHQSGSARQGWDRGRSCHCRGGPGRCSDGAVPDYRGSCHCQHQGGCHSRPCEAGLVLCSSSSSSSFCGRGCRPGAGPPRLRSR